MSPTSREVEHTACAKVAHVGLYIWSGRRWTPPAARLLRQCSGPYRDMAIGERRSRKP